MQKWLQKKLDRLRIEFKAGGGTPMIFEAQYLCYLECLAVARGEKPAKFWDRYTADCEKDTPEGEAVLGHYSRIKDRVELADRILRFENPPPKRKARAKKARAKKPKTQKPAAKSNSEGDYDLFDLFGDDE